LPLIPNGLVRALAAPAENTRNGPHRKTFIIADFSCMLHQGPLRAAIAFDTLNPQSRLFAASKVRKQLFLSRLLAHSLSQNRWVWAEQTCSRARRCDNC
jgi:hypothetical protein